MRFLFLISFFTIQLLFGQETSFPYNGPDDYRTGTYAFTNATIVVDYKTKLENATLLIEKGKIIEVGTNVRIPSNAVVENMKGMYIYPSFIELYSGYGLDKNKPNRNHDGAPKMVSDKKGAYGWNKAVMPEINAVEKFTANNGEAEALRKNGFGVALSHFQDGIVRGTAVLAFLADGKDNDLILKDKAAAWYSFSKGSSDQDYPSSLMGTIALLRQTYLDADWYNRSKTNTEFNLSLEHFNQIQNLPQFFEVYDRLDIFRATKIANEFKRNYIIKGAGDEYMRAMDLKKINPKLIVPVNFPKPYDVTDPIDAMTLDYPSMKHWEMAPSNLNFLYQNGISFCITSSGLEKPEDFFTNIRKAIKRGLPDSIALMNLTYTPASYLKIYDRVGSIEKGKDANFIVCSKPLFDEKNTIHQNWIRGVQHIVKPLKESPIFAEFRLTFNSGETFKAKVTTVEEVLNMSVGKDSFNIKAKISRNKNLVTISFNPLPSKQNNIYRLSGSIKDTIWTGNAELPNGKMTAWNMRRVRDIPDTASVVKKVDSVEKIGELIYPFASFGRSTQTQGKAVIIKNATVWTNEAAGILGKADVYFRDGKIVEVGQNLIYPGVEIVDGTGKHVTSGIIDEHSHIAITRGVNEGTQSSSAEVRIGDVVTSEDINIYRQLAGGVIASQLLHGSANPIGGQSALIKLRWGKLPEEMKIEGADGFIKFALGENVKQSNWGDRATVRYPQTRMGVEQTYYNYFTKAKEYEYNLSKNASQTRRDLELDALVEIMNKKRFITCHSYVQSEINMLMHVADSFGFKVNTFTHILEGFKVADKMKTHGVAASTFSDWWAYKYEVIDAIPYNATILNKMGVVTAINSDDAEMGRRLNQEAAKSVKYGGMSEVDAWKMVTLNPCKMLHLDNHMGSIKPGKDADIVLWNNHPLSVYAKPLQTYVDGVKYFDVDEHKKAKLKQSEDRARLIQKMLKEKEGGASTQKVVPKADEEWNCGHDDAHGN